MLWVVLCLFKKKVNIDSGAGRLNSFHITGQCYYNTKILSSKCLKLQKSITYLFWCTITGHWRPDWSLVPA